MNNTIFDDVFRTMIEKMLYLAVPLINEVFHTSYPEDVKIADYIFRKEEDVRKGIGILWEVKFWNWNLKDLKQKA